MTEVWSLLLDEAKVYAKTGRFDDLVAFTMRARSNYPADVSALLSLGTILQQSGLLAVADKCYLGILKNAPNDLRPHINLANTAHERGEHQRAQDLLNYLHSRASQDPVIHRNRLLSLEYDPQATGKERIQVAEEWGQWGKALAGGEKPRPKLNYLARRPLRVGHVSADFCQHTVGLFIKGVLSRHNPEKVLPFAYSNGQVRDWVTEEIQRACAFRDISGMHDKEVADLIRSDQIDVLVDLSGHTAGSRLLVFAERPAPIMVSWLGYFATTGLEYLDAILLDKWHAPEGYENYFVEPIIRLPKGRWCFSPPSFAPEISSPPCLQTGTITFGSFNNTAKYNSYVFDLWARILLAIPKSRLVLKWRTFNDEEFRQKIANEFSSRGVTADRLELRGPSFHADMLQQYGDIDIALDPFPFSGGMTSCEALWMGCPVVTMPQQRVVSRQTFAVLSVIGLQELCASSYEEYLRLAVDLAKDRERLVTLRETMRPRMLASPLMDVVGFTKDLEDVFINLYREIEQRENTLLMPRKTVLHVGAGHRQSGATLPLALQGEQWREIRLDIDPANEPDILGSMLDMGKVADGSVDAIYSAHNIEHVSCHQVEAVLKEFLRVLQEDGFCVITCPDLQTVCAAVAEDKLDSPLYESPAGPITALDILYGHGQALAAGHDHMAHRCGFTLKTLTAALLRAGFQSSAGKRRARGFDLWIVATKKTLGEQELRQLAMGVFPE